ncbi:acetolactate synthase [Ciceribacter naphthalenivorans]|uniref:Acetolactate synthase n=2 Tax=Alphaproteobacteria TaxID=28211 RepID=A0A512HJP6_9HYPH|nr:acetolactate synthase [Ciceribacter naphthalenivorans]GLR21976.1 acetolactate synthase [Ciceribacter naphthalenivorans]GLT04832.1 acetolactate synthase [Sphingomonas psychrolutea]
MGVDYVFANSGTDFPPIIEGLAEAAASGIDLPQAITIPHEHAAVGMAHGYYFLSGKAQVVMLHTNVGLANGAIGALNAATDHVPMVLMSGRTPTVERGRFGARTVPIGWGQEMRDQTALVREAVKWDYELRFPEQIAEILDRGHAIANSTPKGPVYISLPREVLSEQIDAGQIAETPLMAPAVVDAPAAVIDTAADWLIGAKRPVIFVQRGAGDAEGFAALSALASDFAIPVVHYWATQIGIPTDHPMSVGANPEPWLSEADVILVIDALAPWAPDLQNPQAGARVIQLGPNPLFSRFPVRNFRSDLSIVSETSSGISALLAALRARRDPDPEGRAARRETVEQRSQAVRSQAIAAAEGEAGPVMSKAFVSLSLSQAIAGRHATVLSELGCPLAPMTLDHAQAWYQEPHSGGLGWSLPCAMGMKLAKPDRLVVATLGDGSYMFANPVACHQIMEACEIPVLIMILNNAEWGAVRQSVTMLYPDGYAAKANQMPLTGLSPSPDFTKVAEASNAWARKVTQRSELTAALEAAITEVMENKRTALLDIRVA